MARLRPVDPPVRPRDTATMDWRTVLLGGGLFDVAGEPQDARGWELFELAQRQFWDVPGVIAWDEPVREDPEYAEPIAAMLSFLCPGEKAAVTGASLVSTRVPTEEAKFYFAMQAVEETKHYDAMRRVIPKITGRPMDAPGPSVRMLFSFGVIDPDDVAFMMGNINIIGEHLANQIFMRIKAVATSPQLDRLLELIGRDESRHIAAGRRFFASVWPEYARNRRRIAAKNLATTVLLSIAGRELVNPMSKLGIDLAKVMETMYGHYEDVTSGFPAFPEQALLDALLSHIRRSTPPAIRVIAAMTDERGEWDPHRFLAACERALTSPRELAAMFA